MTKLTAENLYSQMLAARSRADLVKMYLGSTEPDAEFYLSAKGSGLATLKVSLDLVRNLLEAEAARANEMYSELVRKVQAVNQLLSEE